MQHHPPVIHDMATSTFVKSVIFIAALIGMGTAGYYLKPSLSNMHLFPSSNQEAKKPLGSYIGNTVTPAEWANPQTLQAKLAATIGSRIKDTSPTAVVAFMKNPENQLLLAQWQLAENDLDSISPAEKKRENLSKELEKLTEKLTKLREESRKVTPAQAKSLQGEVDKLTKQVQEKKEQIGDLFSLKEYAATPEGQKTLAAVANNLDWMQQILDSGECSQPARALKLVGAMLKAHPESAYNQVERDIITATALEFANNGWKTDRALDRADYFITSWRANRLHTMFDTLPFWQRRIVCGCKGDNNFCTRASLEWALDHVHLPADKYPGCCWRNGYKLYNLYGEIIHGPGYFEPFGDMFGDNSMLFTSEVGGVCGGLSHFGAYSACANGVPATTSGEPAHCSFVVLVDGKWTPAYSLTWDRSLHWTPWQQTYGFSSLHMASKLYSPEQQSHTARSQTELSLANLYAGQAKPDLKKANELYQRAIADQPCNFAAWRAYSRFLEKNKPDDHRVWSQLNALVCKKLAADLPQMAAHILSKFVYPRLGATAASPQELMDDFGKFWGAVDKMEISRWNIEQFLSSQLNLLKKDGKVSDQSKVELYGKVLGTTVSNTAYAPVILSWGSEISAKMDPASQKKILDTTVQTISGDKSIGVKDRDKMLASAVINAEQMRDRKAFQSISRMLSGAYTNPNNKMPQFEPFPGKLVSEDGLLFLSSSSKQHDDPCAHPGVLRLSGGRFHTEKDKEAWAAVELSRLVEVSGVVVVTTPNNMGRMHGMRIQVSESGKDGEWKDVGKPVQEVKQRVNRYDLRTEKPRARFIRVLRPEPADFFHLNGIYVYGTPAS